MQTTTEESSWTTETESPSISSIGKQILENFKASKEYRHAFIEEKVRTSIAAQIMAIRKQREMSRPGLARLMGKAPSWVFRLEDPNEAPPTVSTLLQVAEAYDVDLEIRFSPFSVLIDRLDHLTPESFEIPSFEEEIRESAYEAQEAEAIASGKLIAITRNKGGLFTRLPPPEITDTDRPYTQMDEPVGIPAQHEDQPKVTSEEV